MASKDTSLVGVWRLVSTRAVDPEGRQVGVPFGPRGMGLVTLTSDGRMMAVLVDGRATLPEGTPRQYSSYCGHHHRRRQLRSRALHRAAGPQGPLRRRAHDPDTAAGQGGWRRGDSRTDMGAHQRAVAIESYQPPELVTRK